MRICVSIAFIAAIGVSGCSADNDAEATLAVKPRPAKLVQVTAASNQRDLSFPAVIQAAQTAELTFQVGGEIREII